MNIEVVSHGKGEAELKLDNVTIAEILRKYLSEQDVDFVAWRREHPDKPIVMKIQDSNVKKSVSEAVAAIKKDLDAITKLVKK